MLKKLNLFIFFISSVILSSISPAQEKISEYEPSKVIEGSNLTLYTSPNIRLEKSRNNNTNKPVFGYYFDLSAGYSKWRFTDRTDYSVRATVNAATLKLRFDDRDEYYSSADVDFKGGLSYYLLKNKIFTGAYTRLNSNFDKYNKPGLSASIYPYIGYGKITDAFIVNETSNFENVLKDEKYISKPFDKKTRMLLNSLLDKRNGSVFRSLYKGDDEVEFFTALEKLLLEEKIIDKPLNARVTMKLYRTLYDRNFILFPLYKGFQIQAEFMHKFQNTNDTLEYPQTLSLNSAYGLPLSNRSALLFAANFVFPLNSEYTDDYYSFNLHSPLFLRSEFEQINNFSSLRPRTYGNNRKIYSYKFSAAVNIFHYITPVIGVTGKIEYSGAHRKIDNYTDYQFLAYGNILLNIINKLRLSTGAVFYYYDNKDFYMSLENTLSYYIF